jgi:hypothetical protein
MANDDFQPSPKKWRRKKVRMGKAIIEDLTIKLSETEEARRKDRGLYCKACKKWRRWCDLISGYRSSGGQKTLRTWTCPKCHNVLREDEL